MPGTELPPLNAVRVFEAAARLGNFKAAAEELNVTPSAISHQVANLETFLGTPLFSRSGRRVKLNTSGETYLRQVDDIFERLAKATQSITSGATDMQLTVLASPSFATKWLLPRIDKFLKQHPDWRVRVEASTNRHLPADTDIGIFYGSPEGAGLTVGPLVTERIMVLCAPHLLETGPPARQPADLADHVLIESNTRQMWHGWLKQRGVKPSKVRRMMSVERSSFAIDAATRGLGVILESDFLAADELAEGKLVALFDENTVTQAEEAYFLATRKTAGHKPAVEAFMTWLEQEMAHHWRATST